MNQLQETLDNVRRNSLAENSYNWIDLYKPFPFVIRRLKALDQEGVDFIIITTKSAEFTAQLLRNFNIFPKMIFGHEAGSKQKVLLHLISSYKILGFIEDRLETLITTLQIPQLRSLQCFLAEWGYLKPTDITNLPDGIRLLETKKLAAPLASWN